MVQGAVRVRVEPGELVIDLGRAGGQSTVVLGGHALPSRAAARSLCFDRMGI
ncbi:hypothetical protein HMPREF0058_1015 [Actinomyces urogenitalis DSM 15434]|uniref:Uncharacterized protein n=1 Tax=Actinomyces urogenitalis DSM 15434 TaxID=525246 RepID=C0W571_9ACTO|nr:hypothetical protein HMPREF0058_1015 [Actinomyces urogenitalis DSM 15434]